MFKILPRDLLVAGVSCLLAVVMVGCAGLNSTNPSSSVYKSAQSQSLTDSGATLVPAFYVATNGNDNNPGTLSQPFATLHKAQYAMRGSSIKTTYIRAGTYKPLTGKGCDNGGGASVYLSASDNGETWSFYPPDGYNSAILDGQSTIGNSGGSGGNGTGCAFSGSSVSNITVVGLQIENYLYSAFSVHTGNNLKFMDNVVHNLTAAAWGAGAVAVNCTPGLLVKNNYLYNLAYTGLELLAGTSCPDGIAGIVASGNVIVNSCTWPAVTGFGNDQNGGDCGAIYMHDGTGSSTNIQVVDNYIRDVNKASNGAGDYGTGGKFGCCANGVYLDTGTHYVTIKGNVIAGIMSSCAQLNDPAYVKITENICDLATDSGYQSIVIYGRGKVWPSSMPGNTFQHNVVISASTGTGAGYWGATQTPTPMTISYNTYYNYVGSSIKYTGNSAVGSDTNPVYENPQLSGWAYNLALASPVFNSPVSFQGLTGGWGPPGFVMPHTGTPPSSPH